MSLNQEGLDFGRKLRDEALEQVEGNASLDWLASAESAVRRVGASQRVFTADDVWRKLSEMNVPPPREPRALGAVINGLSRRGGIVKGSHPGDPFLHVAVPRTAQTGMEACP